MSIEQQPSNYSPRNSAMACKHVVWIGSDTVDHLQVDRACRPTAVAPMLHLKMAPFISATSSSLNGDYQAIDDRTCIESANSLICAKKNSPRLCGDDDYNEMAISETTQRCR